MPTTFHAFDDEDGLDTPAPRYAPRAADEWQGMRVDLEEAGAMACAGASSCGLGLACIDGRCSACTDDDQCAEAERCALDHCLPWAQVECVSRRDCMADQLCALSAYSPSARGNDEMRATCLDAHGGQSPAETDEAVVVQDNRLPEQLGMPHVLADVVTRHARQLMKGESP